MKKDYLRWSEIPYAGEVKPPSDPVTHTAGSWSLFYLKRDQNGEFLNPDGRRMRLPITHPHMIDFDKELTIVQKTLQNLTPHQKDIGTYYGTGVPTKQWTPVIDRLIDTYGVSPTYAARILATIHSAINDTMVLVWDLKYRWNVARPNQYDQSMKTLLCTPRFPAYPSGHATMSGCTEVVLGYFFPKERRRLKEIAEDDARSRLYAGVHFPSDNTEGLRLGRYIGRVIVDFLKEQRDSNLNPIDTPFKNFLDANIFPESYQQFIPFDFPPDCSSNVIDGNNSKDKNSTMAKPLLYI